MEDLEKTYVWEIISFIIAISSLDYNAHSSWDGERLVDLLCSDEPVYYRLLKSAF